MKTKLFGLAALSLALGLVACKDSSSPNGAVEAAYAALLKNDTQAFVNLLSGPALQKYSSVSAQESLKKDLSEFVDMKLAPPKLLATEHLAQFQDRETYSVKVLNKGQPVFAGKTICEVKMQWVWTNPACHGAPHPVAPGMGPTGPACSGAQANLETQRNCKVVEFNKI